MSLLIIMLKEKNSFWKITYQILLIIWFHFLTFLKWHLIKMEKRCSSQRLKKRAMRKLSMAIKRYRSDSYGWMCSVFWLWWYYMNPCVWLDWHRAKYTHTHTHTQVYIWNWWNLIKVKGIYPYQFSRFDIVLWQWRRSPWGYWAKGIHNFSVLFLQVKSILQSSQNRKV